MKARLLSLINKNNLDWESNFSTFHSFFRILRSVYGYSLEILNEDEKD